MKKTDWTNRKTEDFGAGKGKITFNMPLGGKVLMATVVVRGDVVIAGGTASGNAITDVPGGLLQRIRVRVSKAANSRYGDGLRVDASPRSILRENIFQRRKYIGELSGSSLGNGAAGTYTIYQAIPIYFADLNLGRPIETALNADEDALKSYVIEVDTGNRDTCFTGNDRNFDFTSLKIDVTDVRVAADGDTYNVHIQDHDIVIQGAKDRLEDKNMPTEGALVSMLLMSQTTNQNTFTDGILNAVRLSGISEDVEVKANDIKQAMFDYRLVDAGQTVTGLHYLGFAHGKGGGRLSNVLPLSGLDTKFDVKNPGGAGNDTLTVVTRRVVSPVGYTAIAPTAA